MTAVYLFGSRDVSEEKFEEAASMVSKTIVLKLFKNIMNSIVNVTWHAQIILSG